MLCQHCQKRTANVHFTQIVNNTKVEMYLCEQCAKAQGKIDFENTMGLKDFLSEFIGYTQSKRQVDSDIDDMVCEKCGMDYNQFQKYGKFGCSNCYEKFKNKIDPLLKRLHGNTQHHGKMPHKVSKGIKADMEIQRLKTLLSKAIEEEEYENAAKLRDEIRVLEAEKGN